jgi:1-acyl-sn-glycerol-3-phosphate acyltransferase
MQKNKIERWNQFWKKRKTSTQQIILEEGNKLGFTDNSFSSFTELLDKDFKVEPKSYFSTLTNSFLKEYIIDKEGKAAVVTMIYSSPENSDLISEKLEKNNTGFCFDTTTLTKTLLSDLTANFNYMIWICGFIVLLFLIISFGRIEISLISFFPMCIAFIWILGIMGIFDIHFNIINIILATFIFGIGDDYSIFIMEGLIFEYTYRKKMLKTYKTAVILSAITLFIGIGSLIFAKHPAMFSLAQVTIIGMISVVIIAYTVAPFIFKLVTQKKGKFRLMPITLVNFTKSFMAFFIFFIGSILLTLLGIFILFFGFKSKKSKLLFHQFISNTFKLFSKIIPQVSCKIINEIDEKFETPSIIISNHQSHLDLLYLLMLSPKILALTNEKVWKSPFYGWILRFADYIPISNGIENNVDKISKFVNDGYSILIFPEGTRSEDVQFCDFIKEHLSGRKTQIGHLTNHRSWNRSYTSQN